MMELLSKRLRLRPWRRADREPFAAMNSDPLVMEHMPKLLSRSESDAAVDRIEDHFRDRGFGLWAVEIPAITQFAGFIGLSTPRFSTSFTPCVEIGWRLASAYWNKGYATEGAILALEFGFFELRLNEVLSWTVPRNSRSRSVMEKLGMSTRSEDDFDHPLLPEGHPLRRHVLYRIDLLSFVQHRNADRVA